MHYTLEIAIFKLTKIALKILNEKKHEQFQDETFETFERVIPP